MTRRACAMSGKGPSYGCNNPQPPLETLLQHRSTKRRAARGCPQSGRMSQVRPGVCPSLFLQPNVQELSRTSKKLHNIRRAWMYNENIFSSFTKSLISMRFGATAPEVSPPSGPVVRSKDDLDDIDPCVSRITPREADSGEDCG